MNEMDMGIFGEEIHMKQRLITLIVAILGLTVELWQAPNVDASSTNRVIKTTNLTKSAYLTKNTQGGFYNMSGAAIILKSRVGERFDNMVIPLGLSPNNGKFV